MVTVTLRRNEQSVTVDLNANQSIVFELQTAGDANPHPLFFFQRVPAQGAVQTIWSQADATRNGTTYTVDWTPAANESGFYVLTLFFADTWSYAVTVKLCDASGNEIRTIKDFTCSSPEPTDLFSISLSVTV
jgi:hypothetical protein